MYSCVQPLAGFPETATSIAGGASPSRKCNLNMPGASSFSKTGRYSVPSTLARRQQFLWQREPVPRGLWTAVATTTSKPPSSRDVSVGAGGGSADPSRTSTEGAAPTTQPGGIINSMRQGSIIGSVGPLHGPGRQRSHASAGKPDRPEGEDQLWQTTSHLGPCCRRTFRRTNQMCSPYSLRHRRRHHRLPGIHRRRRPAVTRTAGLRPFRGAGL